VCEVKKKVLQHQTWVEQKLRIFERGEGSKLQNFFRGLIYNFV